jgi:O-antigen ligase
MLFLVIANNFRDGSTIKVTVATMLAGGLFVNLYGLYQRYYTLELTRRYIENALATRSQEHFMGIPLGPGILDRLGSTRVFSSFLFPNAYAMYLGFIGALTIGWIWSMHGTMRDFARSMLGSFSASANNDKTTSAPTGILKGVYRYSRRIGGLFLLLLFAISCILIPWNLWLTYSRGGWLSALVIVLVILPFLIFKKKSPAGNITALIFATLILGSVFMTPTAESAPQKIRVREESFLKRVKDSATVTQRFSYWRTGFEMVKDRPWLGVGWGAFEKAYPRYMALGAYPTKLAHNNYLQVWAETGIVGLNAFIGMWLIFAYTFWRKMRADSTRELRGIACGLGAGVFGFLAHSLVDFDLYLPTLTYYVFALMGLLVAIPSTENQEDRFSIRIPKPANAILIMCICLYIVFLYRSFMGLYISDYVESERNNAFPTEYAKKRGFEIDPALQQRVLKDCIPLLKQAIAYFPLDADTHHMLGDTYLRLAQTGNAAFLLDEAIREFERAAELNPLSPYIFQSLATAYWLAGNKMRKPDMFYQALQAEKRASQNFPVNPDYHAKLAQIYKALDMNEQSQESMQKAQELKKHYKDY